MENKDVWVVAHDFGRAGKLEELLKHLHLLVADSRQEKGCIEYNCYQNVENPLAFTFFERWESREDLDAHAAGPVIANWLAATADLREPGAVVHVLKDIWVE